MDARWEEQALVEAEGLDAVVYRPDGVEDLDDCSPDTDSDLTDLEEDDDDGQPPPPPVAIPPQPASATHTEAPDPIAAAAAKAEHFRAKNRARMARRRERKAADGSRPPRGEKFVKTAEPIAAPRFLPSQAAHGSLGYVGAHDRGAEYKFLKGTPEEQLVQLRNLGYTFIDSLDISP